MRNHTFCKGRPAQKNQVCSETCQVCGSDDLEMTTLYAGTEGQALALKICTQCNTSQAPARVIASDWRTLPNGANPARVIDEADAHINGRKTRLIRMPRI